MDATETGAGSPPSHGVRLRFVLCWLAPLGFLALAISCAEIPTRPVPVVHVAGSVTDRDGAPTPSAELSFEPLQGAAPFPSRSYAETDSSGFFEVDLYPGRYVARIHVLGSQGLPSHTTFEIQIDPQHARLDFRYTDYWKVQGRVLDPTGAPFTDARLSVLEAGPDPDIYVQARFDSSGFTLFLPGGVYDAYASPARAGTGFPSSRLRGVPVASDTTWEVRLTGDPLTGTITGPSGIPLAGAFLSADGDVYCSGQTDAAGAYRLFLPPGVYALHLPPSPALGSIDPPDLPYLAMNGPASYNLSVTGVAWSGTVRLSGSGDPVPGAAVEAPRAGTYDSSPRDTTDGQGRFSFVVQPGRGYTVSVLEAAGVYRGRTWSPVIGGGDSTFDLPVDPAGP